MSEIKDYPGLLPDETAWAGFGDGEVIVQRRCTECDGGLIYEPVRFCGICRGTGYVHRSVWTPPFRVAAVTTEQEAGNGGT